jgi:hypothetical protein
MAQENISSQLNDLLASRDFQAELLDKEGRPTDAENAEIFTFDFVSSSGKNYGTMVVILDTDNEMQVFYGDNLGRSMEGDDKTEFFDFVQHLHKFANMRRWTYSPKNINQVKYTMQGLAAIKEGLFEGYYGTRRISYSGEPTEARLVIQHNRVLGETDARFRYVESLFIETADSERYRLQFKNLAGGRAMLEHVRQGGRPYDVRGSHITEMVSEIATLSRFNRASAGRVLEGVTAELVTEAQQYYKSLRENLKRMAHTRGYQAYFESWHPAETTLQEELVDSIKTMFVEQTLDSRIEAALPVLARLQQENRMKEADIFESWADHLTEGTWQLPETPEQQNKLQELMSRELIVGPDATNATQQLYDLVGDDVLFDRLEELAARDASANVWDDSEIQTRLAELGVQLPTAEPAVDPAAEPAVDPAAQQPVQESALADLPRPNKRNQFRSLHKLRKQRGLDEQGVTEGDDPWGDQGRFAGDTKVDVGGAIMKMIQVGDIVKYLGQKAEVVALSKDRKRARITIEKGMGGVTQDVNTNDLKQLGQGVTETALRDKADLVAKRRALQDLSRNPGVDQKAVQQRQQDLEKEAKAKDLAEGWKNTNTTMLTESRTYKLWESAGHKLVEAQLTVDQINQIFQQVQQNATAAGDNRTMIGKGKDAASAVNKAWEGLKTKMQNSGPVQGFDQKVSDVLSKIGVGSADPQFNGEVNKWAQKYRDFAKKHPVAQGAIYAALIAVAGISGAGIGGAAALGLLKMADNLLKGERFTSAAYSGAKTGAMAYGASKLGDLIKGKPEGGVGGDLGEYPDGTPKMPGDTVDIQAQHGDFSMVSKVPDGTDSVVGQWNPAGPTDTVGSASYQAAQQAASSAASSATDVSKLAGKALRQEVEAIALKAAEDAIAGGIDPNSVNTIAGTVQGAIDQFGSAAGGKLAQQSIESIAQKAAMVAANRAGGMNESRKLSESQIYLVIGNIVDRQRKLDEGIMDTIKGAAGKAADYVKTKGTNLTTKVTADKLLQAWKKAKSPTDSLDVAKVIQNAGVPAATIKQVFASMQIPFAGEPGAQPTMSRNIPVDKPVPTPSTSPAGAAPATTATQPAATQPAATKPLPMATSTTAGQPSSAAQPAAQTATQPAAVAKPAAAGTVPAPTFNAGNVMKMPGMEKYAKPAAANFAGPTAYGKTTMGFKSPNTAPVTKQPAAPAKAKNLAESLLAEFAEDLDSDDAVKTHKGGIVTKTAHGIKHTKTNYQDGTPGEPGVKSSGKQSRYKQTPILDKDDDLDEYQTNESGGCNHTMEGEMCPEHGLAECGMHESQVQESQQHDADLARLKSLALGR